MSTLNVILRNRQGTDSAQNHRGWGEDRIVAVKNLPRRQAAFSSALAWSLSVSFMLWREGGQFKHRLITDPS